MEDDMRQDSLLLLCIMHVLTHLPAQPHSLPWLLFTVRLILLWEYSSSAYPSIFGYFIHHIRLLLVLPTHVISHTVIQILLFSLHHIPFILIIEIHQNILRALFSRVHHSLNVYSCQVIGSKCTQQYRNSERWCKHYSLTYIQGDSCIQHPWSWSWVSSTRIVCIGIHVFSCRRSIEHG